MACAVTRSSCKHIRFTSVVLTAAVATAAVVAAVVVLQSLKLLLDHLDGACSLCTNSRTERRLSASCSGLALCSSAERRLSKSRRNAAMATIGSIAARVHKYKKINHLRKQCVNVIETSHWETSRCLSVKIVVPHNIMGRRNVSSRTSIPAKNLRKCALLHTGGCSTTAGTKQAGLEPSQLRKLNHRPPTSPARMINRA